MKPEEPAPLGKDVDLPPPKLSEFTSMIDEEINIKDPENWIEATTKKSKKEMI